MPAKKQRSRNLKKCATVFAFHIMNLAVNVMINIKKKHKNTASMWQVTFILFKV